MSKIGYIVKYFSHIPTYFVVVILKYITFRNRVRLGEYDVSKTGVDCAIDPDFDECSEPAVDYKVKDIILHENFNREKGFSNDVGLIRLAAKVRFTGELFNII